MSERERAALEKGPTRERLYELLPAFLRYRDQSEPLDSPLRALMTVLERQHTALERDIQRLYDDWFIETCQEWVAPYLGDLLGVRGLDRPEAWVPGQRTRIANALAYRRLKGNPAVLERVARDVTGWACVASPFFEKLSINQPLEHVRVEKGRTVDLRDRAALARSGGPFDPVARRPQISGAPGLEPAGSPRDGYNLPNLGLYFWRLQSFPVRRRSARKISPGCYTFHPLGIDQPLLNARQSGGDLPEPMSERQVPGPLTRKSLAEELEARRRGKAPATDFFGRSPVLEILDPRTGAPVPWRSIEAADLGAWRRPAAAARRAPSQTERSRPADEIVVALDPERGRLAFAADHPAPGEVEVSYHCAFPGEIGGGPYFRPAASGGRGKPAGSEPATTGEAALVSTDGAARFRSLQEALEARPRGAGAAVVQLVDSATYGGWSGLDLDIALSAGESLELVAAPGKSPAFIGDLRVVVGAGPGPSRLVLGGLIVGGKVIIAAEGDAGEDRDHRCDLEIRHCSLMAPDLALAGKSAGAAGGIEVEPASAERLDLTVNVDSSILGPVVIPDGCGRLAIRDSIVDGGPGPAISGAVAATTPGCPAEVTRCTVFGRTVVAELASLDTIFSHPVTVTSHEVTRAAHCFVPAGSGVGRLEKCQPSRDALIAPAFTSRRHGQPGYAQLAGSCPREIRTGASNGSEMGAYALLGNPFREANLAGILEEYLPWGLEARVFYVT